jgi:hypothetical protein
MEEARKFLITQLSGEGDLVGSMATDLSRCETVALPIGSRQTVISALRNRPNWYEITRREIDSLARLMVERNWFARPVHRARCTVYGFGFSFENAEVNKWAIKGGNPFNRIHDDMIEEWSISESIVAWWKRNDSGDKLPHIYIPRSADVEHEFVNGIEQVSITLPRQSRLKEEERVRLGDTLFTALTKGRKLVIKKDDPELEFRVLKLGKSSEALPVSPLVTIFDDLDYIEAVKVGDWNGAKARWEIIRHTKKGYGVSSGDRAGTKNTHAKNGELKAIVAAMKQILGKQDIATNFDQIMEWLIFPKEHYHKDLLAESKRRLLHWSGPFGLALLDADSQITGLADVFMARVRNEVMEFRRIFEPFLTEIFQSESFLGKIVPPEELTPTWSVQPLYSAKEFRELTGHLFTNALASTPTLRRMWGIDDEREGELMEQSHKTPLRFTPVFEPRQGITAAFTAPESSTGNQNQNTTPADPGRPSTGGE